MQQHNRAIDDNGQIEESCEVQRQIQYSPVAFRNTSLLGVRSGSNQYLFILLWLKQVWDLMTNKVHIFILPTLVH